MSASSLSLEKQGPIAYLSLGRPDRRNAIDGPLLRQLADACEALRFDHEPRVVVLVAEGDTFCEGWDWEALLPDGGSHNAALSQLALHGLPGDVFGCLADLPQPVICAVQGDAFSAGFELALACDVRIAAHGARFAFPEIASGLLPLAGGMQRLARLAGRARALEVLLTGRHLDADEALAWGAINALVPRNRLLAEAQALADRIAQRGPLAVRYAKEAVSRGAEMPLEQALRFETDLTIILQTTEDRAEGVRAFLEKRPPNFQGK